MSLSPDENAAPGIQAPSRLRKIKVAASRAVQAYAARPLHSAFHLTLFGTIIFLFVGLVPLWQTWAVLIVLGGIEFHEWYVKDGYLSPLFGKYFTPRKKK